MAIRSSRHSAWLGQTVPWRLNGVIGYQEQVKGKKNANAAINTSLLTPLQFARYHGPSQREEAQKKYLQRQTEDDIMSETYARLMSKFEYGRCLYRPPSTGEMRPGAVGYWNSEAKWQPITQLDNSQDLKAKGFKPPQEELKPNDSQLVEGWAPLYSSSVTVSNITAKIAAQ